MGKSGGNSYVLSAQFLKWFATCVCWAESGKADSTLPQLMPKDMVNYDSL